MVFKVEYDKESNKWKLFNKTKGEYAKKSFSSKESATKMADHYHRFSQMRKTKKDKTEEKKED